MPVLGAATVAAFMVAATVRPAAGVRTSIDRFRLTVVPGLRVGSVAAVVFAAAMRRIAAVPNRSWLAATPVRRVGSFAVALAAGTVRPAAVAAGIRTPMPVAAVRFGFTGLPVAA